jgi:hypothetical protein
MSGLGLFFTPNGIVVTSGGAAAAVALARIEGAIVSGEASAIVVNAANNTAPAVALYNDAQLLASLTTTASNQNLNGYVRESFAAMVGTLAGAAFLPAGPGWAVVADMWAGETFKQAYDLASDWSSKHDWSSLYDFIDDVLGLSYDDLIGPLPRGLDPKSNANYLASRNFRPQSDPLTLDLDGDGLETVGINAAAPILFDHDGDSIKTATGWVKSDDGLLVYDRDGNGSIDSGRELFGDSTALYTGGTAADGFAALAQEDTNLDGLVNAADANFANLRIWRDLNQDGISQTGELFTLASQNIVALKVAKTANNQTLANGNQIADLGGYIKTDGTEGALGEVVGMGDINLASNPFYSEFPDHIPLTEAAQDIANMQRRTKGVSIAFFLQQSCHVANALT